MKTKDDFLKLAIQASLDAGREIMAVYETSFAVEMKEDRTPLTEADKRAHQVITKKLSITNLPVLSEEGRHIHYEERKNWKKFWMVDPLDGTKEFINRNGEFTANIALIEKGKPVLGVIFAPVRQLLYFASVEAGAYKAILENTGNININEIAGEKLPLKDRHQEYKVVASRSHFSPETEKHIDELKKDHPDLIFVSAGSSLKFCLIADGSADIYPRFGTTMEWDTAAGQAIVEISGGTVLDANKKAPLVYNKPELLNPWFIAFRQASHLSGDGIPGT